MNKNNCPYIFVIGNEKGGAGKTTCAIHLITALLYQNKKVLALDTDVRQASLAHYLQNRDIYNRNNIDNIVPSPQYYFYEEKPKLNIEEQTKDQESWFLNILNNSKNIDYIVIDTPGSYSYLSRLVHSHANTIITPINDSFIDLDVIAKIDRDNITIIQPSIYSQMIWEQKMQKAARDGSSIEWIILRNRLSTLDATNKKNITKVLDNLSKRISFKIAPGFSERVIFKELFLQGLTLLDLKKTNYVKNLNISHVAARQELRNLLAFLGLENDAII
jgi:chromosome partitioning protein